jgi:uncharacterized protein (TIGR02687 family)
MALHAVYDALVAAAEFFSLRNQYQRGFDFEDRAKMYQSYERELYRFDQFYRHFCEAADQAETQGWNILKPLRDSIEASYTNWFVPNLALVWGKFVEPQGPTHLLTDWQIDKTPRQQDFFEYYVRPRLKEADNRRVYVIISDAFRYEAAHELAGELNGKYRFEATLTSQLGVLPSYTALGMASLLPHKSLTYKSNGDVLVDGNPTSLTEQRDEILKAVEGMACKATYLLALKKDQGRDFVKEKRVVYVYHNTIDAVGESTEEKTFDAVRTAIDELAALVHLQIVELHNSGPTAALTLSTFVALCSGVMGRPIQQQMVVLGSMSLGGNIIPVENLAESLQVALDSGARRILLPMASVRDIPTIPGELFAKFQTSFYSDPIDAVFKAIGVQ